MKQQGAGWGARKDVIQRAIFGVVQVLDGIGNPPGGIEVEASFDEFNLDIRIHYAGAPLVIPERKPTPREIIADDDGERLLAGYLLRQTADRVQSRGTSAVAELVLHYDH
jgi:NCS2 family nucleobase:cation symporter-2